MSAWRLFRSSAALEAAHLLGSRGFVALTALAAVSFLAMVSLFGLTGSYAPVALIDRDGGPLARRFIEALDGAHHSFALTYLSEEAAEAALGSGRLVGIITIPAGFSDAVARGTTVAVDVRIDNVNVDLTNDVQRAFRRRSSASRGSTASPARAWRWSSTTSGRTTPATSPTWR